ARARAAAVGQAAASAARGPGRGGAPSASPAVREAARRVQGRTRAGHARRRSGRVGICGAVVGVGGAGGGRAPGAAAGPPARPGYPYAPSPVSGPANPNTCRKELVMGDSLAFEASDELQAKYTQYGYCVTLVKGATFGGNTMVDADGNPQSPRLANFLAGAP